MNMHTRAHAHTCTHPPVNAHGFTEGLAVCFCFVSLIILHSFTPVLPTGKKRHESLPLPGHQPRAAVSSRRSPPGCWVPPETEMGVAGGGVGTGQLVKPFAGTCHASRPGWAGRRTWTPPSWPHGVAVCREHSQGQVAGSTCRERRLEGRPHPRPHPSGGTRAPASEPPPRGSEGRGAEGAGFLAPTVSLG